LKGIVQLSDLKGIVQAHTGQGTLPNFGRAKQFSKQETTSSSWTPVQSSKGFSGHTTQSPKSFEQYVPSSQQQINLAKSKMAYKPTKAQDTPGLPLTPIVYFRTISLNAEYTSRRKVIDYMIEYVVKGMEYMVWKLLI
jgi:hypothetical protein